MNKEQIIQYLEEIKNIGESYEDCLNYCDNPLEGDIYIIAENVEKIKELLKGEN